MIRASVWLLCGFCVAFHLLSTFQAPWNCSDTPVPINLCEISHIRRLKMPPGPLMASHKLYREVRECLHHLPGMTTRVSTDDATGTECDM